MFDSIGKTYTSSKFTTSFIGSTITTRKRSLVTVIQMNGSFVVVVGEISGRTFLSRTITTTKISP